MSNGRTVMLCGHCGNRTAFEARGTCPSSQPEHPVEGLEKHALGLLLECLSCSNPTLVERWHLEDTNSYDDSGEQETVAGPFEAVCFPTISTALDNLPDAVARAYGEALKVRPVSPSACAVTVGRTLEAVRKHEQVAGRSLADKLRDHANSDKIPPRLGQMAQQLRAIRNLGAHAAEDEVSESDVPIILDFVGAILEYLYVAPAKIDAVEERLTGALQPAKPAE